MRNTAKRARLIMEDKNVDLQEGIRVRSVRRRIFQDDDDNGDVPPYLRASIQENNVNQFYEEARKDREAAKKRWNFDFEKEEPLSGCYEWVKLDKDGNEIPPATDTENQEKVAKEESEKTKNGLEEKRETRENSQNSDSL